MDVVPSGTEMGLVDDYLGLKSEAIECRRSATRNHGPKTDARAAARLGSESKSLGRLRSSK